MNLGKIVPMGSIRKEDSKNEVRLDNANHSPDGGKSVANLLSHREEAVKQVNYDEL